VHIKRYEIPEGWSIEAADFINKVKILTLLMMIVLAKEAIK
jgi:hypothetical protein